VGYAIIRDEKTGIVEYDSRLTGARLRSGLLRLGLSIRRS
jgi:hypothetical protein